MTLPENIYDLILSKLSGQIDGEDERTLTQWLEESSEHRHIYAQIAKTVNLSRWAEDREHIAKNAAWANIRRKRLSLRRRRAAAWGSVAASFLIAAVVATFLYRDLSAGGEKMLSEIDLPANKAILELSDGTRHVIGGGPVAFTEQDGTMLAVTDEGIVYDKTTDPDLPQTAIYNKVIVPRGAVAYRISLPDGSAVWLNSDSRLEYPVAFGEGERRVFLEGEAYFDVVPDLGNPFIVGSEGQSVTVLGTQFNVSAYSEDQILTTLVSGKVSVTSENAAKETLLSPGQQSVLDRASSAVSVENVDVSPFVAWTEGVISLENMPLEKVLNAVSRRYDVAFDFSSTDIRGIILDGSISGDESLHVVLSVLTKIGDVKFKINRDGRISVVKL